MLRNTVIGTLIGFFESGSDGVLWSIYDNNSTGYESLNILKDGDYLFVEDGNKGIEWEGYIKLEYIRFATLRGGANNMLPYFQQQVAGYWVHGLQDGVDPEVWARWFFEERSAVIIKGVNSVASIDR